MYRFSGVGLAVLLLGALSLSARADEGTKEKKGETDPPGAPLEAKLVPGKTTYQLDLGGQTSEEFRKLLKDADNTGNYPPAAKVDLMLELRNTGKEDIQIQVGGTNNVVTLDLQGPGAVSVKLLRRITPHFIIAPKVVTLTPGKTETVPITSLSYGRKGSDNAYWTQAGAYTLAASYQTAVNPAPKGSQDAGNGFGAVTVTSAPITIKVEGK